MFKRTATLSVLALGLATVLAGCGDTKQEASAKVPVTETKQACLERFSRFHNGNMALVLKDRVVQATYTFDIATMSKEEMVELAKTFDGKKAVGTLVSGSSSDAVKEFMKQDVTKRDAVLWSSDASLWRTNGGLLASQDIVDRGCSLQTPGKKLIEIGWAMPESERSAAVAR